MKQIMIVGAGSVSGFFGAQLVRKYPHVSFLLRPKTLEAVKANGLTIRSQSLGSFSVRPQYLASDPTELPAPDLIILGVKAYDFDEVCVQIEPVMQADTIVLTLQNGVTIEESLAERFGRERIVGGVAYIYSKIIQPGVIEHYKRGALKIGELDGQQTPRVNQIAALLSDAGVACPISSDIRRAKWEKMCWNCVFNPLTVLFNDRVSKALDHAEMSSVISTIVREVVMVAAGHGVVLGDHMAENVVQSSQELRDIHTSMYDDWKAGRPTEIDALNGYIVRKGKEFGVPTPVNESLTAMVKVMTEHNSTAGDTFLIEGLVLQPLSFDITSLGQLSEEAQVPDISVVMPKMKGRGVRLSGLLDVATLQIEAGHVTFHSQDGQFAATLTIAQAREFGILIYEVDGNSLSSEKGGPFRLVTPGLGDLCANVKHVARIEITQGAGRDTRPPDVCT
ncbi:2-dehydropantoate 2-reductase [Nitrospira sp. M1]